MVRQIVRKCDIRANGWPCDNVKYLAIERSSELCPERSAQHGWESWWSLWQQAIFDVFEQSLVAGQVFLFFFEKGHSGTKCIIIDISLNKGCDVRYPAICLPAHEEVHRIHRTGRVVRLDLIVYSGVEHAQRRETRSPSMPLGPLAPSRTIYHVRVSSRAQLWDNERSTMHRETL